VKRQDLIRHLRAHGCSLLREGRGHSVWVNAVMADGHVQFFKNSININVWRSLASSQGGEVLDASSF
jgi:prepilin-type processing-associated H-X9-DG protein